MIYKVNVFFLENAVKISFPNYSRKPVHLLSLRRILPDGSPSLFLPLTLKFGVVHFVQPVFDDIDNTFDAIFLKR
jgi:hypothetical protein